MTVHPPAPLWRRFAAMIYDSLLVFAIWMLVGYGCLALFGIDQAQRVEGGRVIMDPAYQWLLFSAMVLSALGFFCGFWMASGQTLGMQAWRIRLQNPDGDRLSLGQCLRRCLLALPSLLCLGLGYWPALLDAKRQTLPDRFSHSQVVLLPPKKKKV